MSMIGYFQRLPRAELARVRADERRLDALFAPRGDQLAQLEGMIAKMRQTPGVPAFMIERIESELAKTQARAASQPDQPDTSPLPPRLDIGKTWHGLHYLLAGDAEATDPPPANAILGGVEIGGDRGYGPARLLEPSEVAAVADALAALGDDELRARFDPEAMEAADIYAFHADEGEDALEELLEAKRDVAAYYAEAREAGDAMLLWLS